MMYATIISIKWNKIMNYNDPETYINMKKGNMNWEWPLMIQMRIESTILEMLLKII